MYPPSAQMALDHIGPCSDSDAKLSDPPEDFDNMDVDVDEDFKSMALISPFKRKAISRSVISDDDESVSDFSDLEISESPAKKAKWEPHINSKFEDVPTEVRASSVLLSRPLIKW